MSVVFTSFSHVESAVKSSAHLKMAECQCRPCGVTEMRDMKNVKTSADPQPTRSFSNH